MEWWEKWTSQLPIPVHFEILYIRSKIPFPLSLHALGNIINLSFAVLGHRRAFLFDMVLNSLANALQGLHANITLTQLYWSLRENISQRWCGFMGLATPELGTSPVLMSPLHVQIHLVKNFTGFSWLLEVYNACFMYLFTTLWVWLCALISFSLEVSGGPPN